MSDHFPVFFFECTKQIKLNLSEKVKRNINKQTVSSFCTLLKSTKWTTVINEKVPKLAFNNFFEILNSARDLAFPEIKVKQKPVKFFHSPWMTQGLRVSQKRKEKLFAKKIKNPTEPNILKFKMYNSIYNKLRRASKKIYFESQFKNFSKNSKKTWALIREIIGAKKEKLQIPDYFKVDKNIITNNLDIANGFKISLLKITHRSPLT